ncbi:flagellin [Sphingosinicella sp. CPCC 101087]|uniref:flagellin N-terminal helical domain-containing protein n=1 Tax=Sphingosinicella sp. CPCC 101087 TaxID=2497754 RepID=UPI00101DD7BD|nr:flagellin [Sphingosinicella sp. CPCC 101087]
MITGTRYRLTLEIGRHAQLARDIERSLTEISTGKRIQAPSDDPVGAARVSDIARMQSDIATWKRNLDAAAGLSARADDAISATVSAITRAKELMLSAATGTTSADSRAIVALELRSIASEIAALQETRDPRGNPLFPIDEPLEIPAGEGVRITAVGTRASVFEADTAGGLKDIVAIISDAADAIEEPDATRAASVDAALAEMDAAVSGITRAQGEQGTRGNRIDNLLTRLSEFSLQAEEERKSIESTDVMEVIARLQARQLTLEAAQAAFTRINSGTLFDMLR